MANSAQYKHMVGADRLVADLKAYPDAMRNEVLGVATKALCQPILVAAKRFAKRSERTGALRESLVVKVKVYKNSNTAVGLVGPDRAYYRKGKKSDGKLGRLLADSRPANYAHLVEYGHHAVKPRKGDRIRKKTAEKVSWVPAKPFIRPAVLTTIGAQASEFTNGLRAGMDKIGRKAIKAGFTK